MQSLPVCACAALETLDAGLRHLAGSALEPCKRKQTITTAIETLSSQG